MTVSLTRSDVPAPPSNQVMLTCPRCDRAYWLTYTDDEWNRVKDWIGVAQRALREDHKARHERPSVPLNWQPVRPR